VRARILIRARDGTEARLRRGIPLAVLASQGRRPGYRAPARNDGRERPGQRTEPVFSQERSRGGDRDNELRNGCS
jgi:hypothetical protein